MQNHAYVHRHPSLISIVSSQDCAVQGRSAGNPSLERSQRPIFIFTFISLFSICPSPAGPQLNARAADSTRSRNTLEDHLRCRSSSLTRPRGNRTQSWRLSRRAFVRLQQYRPFYNTLHIDRRCAQVIAARRLSCTAQIAIGRKYIQARNVPSAVIASGVRNCRPLS